MKKAVISVVAIAAVSVAGIAVVKISADAATICNLPGKKKGKLNLRRCAGTKCKVIGSYREGRWVDPLGYKGRWIKVRINKKKGYMSDKYLCGDDIDFG
jgi:uncharacterized protein YgiM (DUF1202 family)